MSTVKPHCDLCIRAGMLKAYSMKPVTVAGVQGDAFQCQVHPTREYHPHVGYQPQGTAPIKDSPLRKECGKCASTLYCYISDAKSRELVTMKCVACGHEHEESI